MNYQKENNWFPFVKTLFYINRVFFCRFFVHFCISGWQIRHFTILKEYIILNIESVTRVFVLQYMSNFVGTDVGIYLSSYYWTVSKKLLYVTNIYIFIKQSGGKGVAEHMRGYMHLHARRFRITVDHIANRLFWIWIAELVGKEIFAIVFPNF